MTVAEAFASKRDPDSRLKFYSIIALITILSFNIYDRITHTPKNPISWDTFGYYLYLPATFIYHDLGLKDKAVIDVKTRNVMGVVVPAVKSDYHVKSFEERGYGLIGTSSYIDEAAESYEVLLKNIIVAAEIENTLRKLLTEIDKTKRRVNALEFKVIPEMKKNASFIRLRLEEMERDDLFRLKKIKSKSKRKAALKEQEAS